MNTQSLNLLVINCDWRNIFETGFDELYKKLERDRLNPEFNNFLFLSWSNENYYKKRGERFSSAHIKTRWHFFRPIFDFLSVFLIPYRVFKYHFKPDVIIVYDFGFLPTAKIIKIFFGGRIILCLTNMPELTSKTRNFGRIKSFYSFLIERLFGSFIDKAYTLNDTMRIYLERLGIRRDRIVIFASNTINRDLSHVHNSQKGVVRSKYNLPVDKKIILSVGRLEAEKNFSQLLNIFSKLNKDYVLIILGQGSLKDSLEKQAQELNIKDRVIFQGFVEREDIWNYYNDADVFILLSKAEALGLVFWEAMYMGVPVIGSRVGGIQETIGSEGLRGFFWEEKDGIKEMEDKISRCLSETEELKNMKKRARLYVEEKIKNNITINDIFK